MNILVSIIIPVFNNAEGLCLSLAAISSQVFSMGDYEVVVVDNGSTLPLKISDVYSFPLRVVRVDKPGSYVARNAGVALAKGRYLAFLDSDCEPDKLWLQSGVGRLQAEFEQKLVGGDVLFCDESLPTLTARYQQIMGFGQERNINKRGFSAAANLFCTREQFTFIGWFDETLRSAGDREWCWRARNFGIELVFEPDAVVVTQPRNSLRAAIRQARRVEGGRFQLRSRALSYQYAVDLERGSSVVERVQFIVGNKELVLKEKMGILFVAGIIRVATLIEHVRLRLGGVPERR